MQQPHAGCSCLSTLCQNLARCTSLEPPRFLTSPIPILKPLLRLSVALFRSSLQQHFSRQPLFLPSRLHNRTSLRFSPYLPRNSPVIFRHHFRARFPPSLLRPRHIERQKSTVDDCETPQTLHTSTPRHLESGLLGPIPFLRERS